MIEIISAMIGAVIMCILYHLALHVLDKQEALALERSLVFIVGSVMAVAWIAISLMQESMALPQQILTMCTLWSLAVLTVTDWKKHLIPNRFLVLLLMIWATVTGINIILDIVSGMALLFTSLAGGIMGGLIFFLCYIISRKQLGAGDVKLVFVLGLYLTGQRIMGAIFYGVILCCVFSLIQLCRKKIGMKDGIPLVPFLFLGTLITLFIL